MEDYADLIAPLQDLKKGDVDFTWGPAQKESFERTKSALVNTPMFTADQWQTNEETGEATLRVISHGSRSLTGAQTRYAPAKLDMFAALKMIEKFAPHLTNKKFTLRASDAAFLWLRDNGEEGALAARWISRLENFKFSLEPPSEAIKEQSLHEEVSVECPQGVLQ